MYVPGCCACCNYLPSVQGLVNSLPTNDAERRHEYLPEDSGLVRTAPRVTVFIIRLTHANVWESMGKPCSCTQFIKSRIFYYKSRENPYQYCKSRENPYQVLQVTRESVSGTTRGLNTFTSFHAPSRDMCGWHCACVV